MTITPTATTTPEGFAYLPDFLPPAEHDTLLGWLGGLSYARDTFRGRTLKRAYAQFGFAYVSVGRRLGPAPPLPPALAALADAAARHCPAGTRFNQCIVTHYPAGAGIGWHPDAPCFGDCVAALSLGAPARLQFGPAGAGRACYELVVRPGSLYVMRGPARWAFDHRVVAVRADRRSITFRHVDGGDA